MAVESLHELLKHELGDLLFAEKTVLKALKKMEREVKDPAVRDRIVEHQGETEQQIDNLESAFEAIGERAKAQKCAGILGIVAEHDEFKSEEEPEPELLEAFNLGAGLRVEHYEIAAYQSAIALARATGQRECVDLLTENLQQEVEMERFLRGVSGKALKQLDRQLAASAAE
jgi:ferritin-like metal-binding protein YciE